jgi:hypothetical protein
MGETRKTGFDIPAPLCQYLGMIGETKKQFLITIT